MSKLTLTTSTIIQVTSYYPPHLGGMENVAAQIAERLIKKGNEVFVIHLTSAIPGTHI